MNNPFDYTPDEECREAFRQLLAGIEVLKKSPDRKDVEFCRELEEGKMLGVMIAVDDSGARHTLYAFSGQLGDGGFRYPGFVGPIFDYLRPDGYFKTKEAEISRLNKEIAEYEAGPLTLAKTDFDSIRKRLDGILTAYKEECRLSKLERDAKRAAGVDDPAELAAMIRQSQFEKAELRRLKKKAETEAEPFSVRLVEAGGHLEAMKERRRSESEALQTWLFDHFKLLNSRGESRSLSEIFAATPLRIPPSGAGECCAPKLLQAAYERGLRPVSIAEFWYGKSKEGEVRIHGEYYPACRGKCLPVLGWMLKGIDVEPPLSSDFRSLEGLTPEIIYENRWFCVVNKPSGMLSVPGKGSAASVEEWLKGEYGTDRMVKMVHRLDQDTSGLLIAAFDQNTFKILQTLFATRKIRKDYVAELDGDYRSRGIPKVGRIELPLSPDWLDRPRQRVDYESGKEAVTDYEFIGVTEGRSRVVFHPLTGRTHQLRVHAASESGLGLPIVGDRLYGRNKARTTDRLHLHARRIEFTFPPDGRTYTFEVPDPF